MQRILCYGDSNTWGYNPLDASRYDEDARWPTVMADALGDGYRVVEEGMNGRTFSMDDPNEGGHRSGIGYLPACLISHNPLDLVIVMLGTNDTKERFGLNAASIAINLRDYVRVIRDYAVASDGHPAKILIVAPPRITSAVLNTLMGAHFGADAPQKSDGFHDEYLRQARLYKTAYFDAATVAQPSARDGVHLTRDAQRALGRALAEKTRELFEGGIVHG